MIYTLTFNPSLDYVVRLDALRPGQINRVTQESVIAGGKGINVSIVLHNLGHESCAMGFVAGFTGLELRRMLATQGVTSDFVEVTQGKTRINVKVHAQEETEINGMGPHVTEADMDKLYGKLDGLKRGDILIVSGSVPASMPANMYERILERLDGRGVDFVVDSERDLLSSVLPYRPFLVKPNNHELGDLFGVELATRDEVVPYAKRLQEQGARNVLVSLAGEGAVLVSERGSVLESEAPRGTVVNSVGAGDSMVAGFVAGYQESQGDYETALRLGICTGSATAFKTDLATRPEVEALLASL